MVWCGVVVGFSLSGWGGERGWLWFWGLCVVVEACGRVGVWACGGECVVLSRGRNTRRRIVRARARDPTMRPKTTQVRTSLGRRHGHDGEEGEHLHEDCADGHLVEFFCDDEANTVRRCVRGVIVAKEREG